MFWKSKKTSHSDRVVEMFNEWNKMYDDATAYITKITDRLTQLTSEQLGYIVSCAAILKNSCLEKGLDIYDEQFGIDNLELLDALQMKSQQAFQEGTISNERFIGEMIMINTIRANGQREPREKAIAMWDILRKGFAYADSSIKGVEDLSNLLKRNQK